MVRPSTTIGLIGLVAVPVAPPFDEVQVASKCSTALPPSLPGANTIDADPFAGVAVPIAGASGTPEVMRPIELPLALVNHKAPSGPGVIVYG